MRKKCESKGKRLCTATEWEKACKGLEKITSFHTETPSKKKSVHTQVSMRWVTIKTVSHLTESLV